jgi:hypothetical protein
MAARGRTGLVRIAAGGIAALIAFAPVPASAAGLFESLFGGLRRAFERPIQQIPDRMQELVDPLNRSAERAPAREDRGPARAFCVRTCDGHYFPVRAHPNMSAAEACRAFCPSSETRLYGGSNIDHAVARDGTRYGALKTAYLYRKQITVGCTCNGRNQFGVANTIDVTNDPTLRRGDVVATRDGLVAYTGKKDDFTPVENYSNFSKRYRDSLSGLRVTDPVPDNADARPETPAAGDQPASNHSAQLTR